MTTAQIAAAMQRVESVLRRRPESGLHDDAPATARWRGGVRVVSQHPIGVEVASDMPVELGGSGEAVTPGWLLRAGLASCLATRIAMAAAAEGIELGTLEVDASSRSDLRGLLGMAAGDGQPVSPAAFGIQLLVRIGAAGVAGERLQAMVEASHRCSPVAATLAAAPPVVLRIDVAAA